jgi:ABC-type Fe3+ transport system permease subunit
VAAMQLTRTHRILIGVVVFGAVIIAAIGFAGSYTAVRELAEAKGFGTFSIVFPIGIDAGICVLLSLDLLLTWLRIPFPLLRQSAWLLTIATIAFNAATAWPDPLGVGMHAVSPSRRRATRSAGSRTSRPTSTWRAYGSPAGCSRPSPRSSCGAG